MPVAVKLVSEATIEGKPGDVSYSCKLNYANELVGKGTDFKVSIGENGTSSNLVTLLNPIEGKLDTSKWKTCCDSKTKSNFNVITQNTVCSG